MITPICDKSIAALLVVDPYNDFVMRVCPR
jgi:hypothetical protein